MEDVFAAAALLTALLSMLTLCLVGLTLSRVKDLRDEMAKLAERIGSKTAAPPPIPKRKPVTAPAQARVQAPLAEKKVAAPTTPKPAPAPSKPAAPAAAKAASAKAPRPPAPTAVPAPKKAAPPKPTVAKEPKRKRPLELALGVHFASFIGIAVVIIGVVFFVVYAIQQNLISPTARVALGAAVGLGLVGLSEWLRRGDAKRYAVLGNALAGGGVCLFYFSVFAAFRIYALIGQTAAGTGLVLSAVLCWFLAARHNAQPIAVLGLLGAYVMPAMVSSTGSLFALVYYAAVNAPVILLGIRRRWQGLYNTAFALTLTLGTVALGAVARAGSWDWALALLAVYYLQFAILGLQKVRAEGGPGHGLDQARLWVLSLALLAEIRMIIELGHVDDALAPALACAAVLQGLIAWIAWRMTRAWRDETLTFVTGAVTALTLAIPAYFDGNALTLAWAIEGTALAAWAISTRVRFFQWVGAALTMLGLLKASMYDTTFLEGTAPLLFNVPVFCGLASAAAMALQSWLHARRDGGDKQLAAVTGFVAVSAIAGVAWGRSIVDETFTVQECLFTSWAQMLAGLAALAWYRFLRATPITHVGLLFLAGTLVKIVTMDLGVAHHDDPGWSFLLNATFVQQILQVALVAACVAGARRRLPSLAPWSWSIPFDRILGLASGVAVIVLGTAEILRVDASWSGMAVTLWWAAAAMALTAIGVVRRRAAYRYAGLLLFGIDIVKVFLVDLSYLGGIRRIAAFIGLGVLLLVLSFVYQRLAERLFPEAVDDAEATDAKD